MIAAAIIARPTRVEHAFAVLARLRRTARASPVSVSVLVRQRSVTPLIRVVTVFCCSSVTFWRGAVIVETVFSRRELGARLIVGGIAGQ